MGKVRVMSMGLRMVAVALVAAISCVCVKADDSAGSGVTMSGTVLTEPGIKLAKKAKVLVLMPEYDFAGETKVDKHGAFSIGLADYKPDTHLLLRSVDENLIPCGTVNLNDVKCKGLANDSIIDILAESTLDSTYIANNADKGLEDVITSISGVYSNPLSLYRDHKVIMILVDGKRWVAPRMRGIDFKRMIKSYIDMQSYYNLFNNQYNKRGSISANDDKHPIMQDLSGEVPYKDIVRIDYVTRAQSIALCDFIAPGGVLLITTKADPEMKWVDDLRLTMVEL